MISPDCRSTTGNTLVRGHDGADVVMGGGNVSPAPKAARTRRPRSDSDFITTKLTQRVAAVEDETPRGRISSTSGSIVAEGDLLPFVVISDGGSRKGNSAEPL